jgi:hypothetical protein
MASLEKKITVFNMRVNCFGYGMVYFATVMERIVQATGVKVDDIRDPSEEEL